MIIRGYVFEIFPVDYNIETDEVEFSEHWVNKYFFWLFEFLNCCEGFAADIVGAKHWFAISFRGKSKTKIKELNEKH